MRAQKLALDAGRGLAVATPEGNSQKEKKQVRMFSADGAEICLSFRYEY